MGTADISAIMARLERAVDTLEGNTGLLTDQLARNQKRHGDDRLRSEVTAVIDELNAMIGAKNG